MNRNDIQGFLATEGGLDMDRYVVFEYLIETTIDPIEAAAALCRETSTAQWQRPGSDEDMRPRHGAKAIEIEVLEKSGISAFYDKGGSGGSYIRARARIAHPHINFGTRLPNLLTAAAGEGAFFSHGISSIKLVDISFPDSYIADFQGPQFGIDGLRDILGVRDRPLFFGVVKPNIGLAPEDFAQLAFDAWKGGLDAAKDDEMLSDVEYSPFRARMKLVGEGLRRAEDATGERKIFIANITDEVENLVRLHDIAVECGVGAVMVNVQACGLSAVRMLRKHATVPVVAHFDCIAPMSMHPWFGISTKAMTRLQRMAGCDAIIMPGFGARMKTPDAEVLDNVRACTGELGRMKTSLPVPGGSDWAGSLAAMYEKIGNVDFAMVPGRGVFGHPSGPAAGAMSLRQAWEAVCEGIPLGRYAETHAELREAMTEFGGIRYE